MTANGTYRASDDDADGYEVWREYKDHQRNKVNSFDFNISYNLSDKVYFGYTFGIISAVTNSEGYFYDYYAPGNHPDFPNGLDYTCVDKMNRSDGAGWNMAFGTIIRPVQALRLGAAIKTPTYFHERLEYSDYLYAVMGEGKDGELVLKLQGGHLDYYILKLCYVYSGHYSPRTNHFNLPNDISTEM